MKNYNLIERLWKTDSHEKQTPQRFGCYAAMLMMLLTLGVGQMWADPWVKNDISTGLQGTKTVGDKLNGGSDWWFNYQTNGGWSSGTDIQVIIGTSSSSYSTVDASWYADDGGNKKVHANIGSFTFDKSGKWYAVGKYKSGSTTAYTSGTSFTNNTSLSTSMSTSNSPYWTVNPPSVKSFAVSTDGSDILSGSGTSADPYIIAYNGSLVLSLSGSKNKTDENSSLQYNTAGTWNSTTSRTISSITSTTKTSVTVKMRCYNSTASLSGAESSKTIYYKSEASYNVTAAKTPSAGGSVTPTSATAMGTTSGGNITASPNTGYTFTSWAITSGSGYFGTTGTATTSTTANTKFRPSAATTVTATFTPKTYSITLDGNGGSDGSATATYNSSTLTSVTHCSRASYDLNGYYTATSGGTKVINANGTLVASVSTYTNSSSQWIKDADVELHAQWTYNPVTYSVTYAVGTGYTSYGSLSAKNTSTSAAISSGSSLESGTGVTFTATPNTGYVVEGWYTNAACTSGKHDAGSNTYSTTLSGNITVYVKFVEKTWSVAFAAGTGGTVTTPAATPQTVGQVTGISIAATPATGYTFNTWTITSGSGSFTSAATTNSNTFKPTAASMITASFNETMSSLSTSCHYDAGNPSYAAPTVSNSATTIGYGTTRTITATAAGTGYTFAGWTLTNCTRTDGGSATATSITIRSNGDGAAATVVANYNEVLTSRWHLVGENVASKVTFPNGWTIDNTSMMQKATGHSTESVVYANVTVSNADGTYQFKVVDDNGASSDIWYGYSTGDTYLTWTATSTKNVYSGNGNSNNLKFTPTVAGTYVFKVDYSGTYPAVTITYPVSYTLTYGIGTVKGNNGSISTSPSTSSGSKVISGTNITLTGPAAKSGYTWKGWYTNAAGTEGKIPDTDRAITVTMNANKTLYACYTINNYAITHSDASHGSYTIKVGSAEAVSTNTTSDYGKTITLAATPATGYHFGSWSAYKTGTPATTVTVTSNQFTMPDYAVTVGATFAPNTYRVHFHRNGGAGDVVEQNFTYDVAQNLTANTYTKTGYNFAGWATAADGSVVYADEANVSNLTSTNNGTFHLYAKWTPKTATITYSQSGTGYSTGGQSTTKTATYDAAMPTTISTPTAANGWAFLGYYDALEPLGTQYYNADGTSARTWDKEDASVTLYAYFKKAEITDVELNETMFDPVAAGDEGYVVANPTIAPNPTGDHIICWELLYDNDNPVTGHDAIADPDGSHLNRIKFSIAGLAAGGYKIRTTLRTGSSCAGGTLLDTRVTTFQIANAFTVTVEYKDSEGNTIAASTTSPGKALESTDITAPDLIGYTFSTWQLGEGMSTNDALTTKTDFSYTTTFNSTLTAVYTKKRMIYFNNTLGWKNVYVYFYSDATAWDNTNNGQSTGTVRGSGAKTDKIYNGSTYPYSAGRHGEMQNIDGTDIWYFDMATAGYADCANITFTKDNQHGYEYFSNTEVVRVTGAPYNSTTLPMYVPIPSVKEEHNKLSNGNKAVYYPQGYWMNYPNNTGYVLHIYNSKTYGVSDELMSIPFEYTADKTMPMSLTVELAGGKEYGFEIHRADGTAYGKTSTMKSGASGDDGTPWAITSGKRTGLKTSVAGEYTFTLNYGNNGGYNYLVGVHYPVAANDYRIVYNDRVAWSLGSAHDASWYHPSRAIEKKDGAEDIVSFYVSKEVGASASMKFQYASSVSGEGVVTWSDVDGGSISLSDITESGVYNFYLSQAAGSITVDSIRPYTGQYYIRSQAVTGGWDNYRVGSDHKMTYSEFSESAANTFGEKFSHYKAKWCPRNTNIAFTIANDYSMCITDTLKQDVGNPYSNTDADGKLNNDGNDGHSGSNAYLDPNSANVRFMWNRKTNKISRAYVASSTSSEARFLVLQGSGTANANIFAENGSALSANPPGANATLLRDDQNWIYEITVQANPSALVKLYANYKGQTQYFRGTSDAGFVKGTSAVELLGGTSSSTKYSVRVVYDFKTNRLVTAWQPTGATEEISEELNINADVMVIRKHHESAQCITFANDESALKGVKTVYGVMQFNRWILNNREHPEDDTPEHCEDAAAIATHHRPLAIGDQKSIYERSHYYISFPFDVRLSDVFGFGQYWNEWYIEWYDGLTRAKNGYWIDSPSNWKYVTPEEKDTFVLKANQGYILGLDMDYMQATDFSFWTNKNTTIELYFPSTVSLETLKSTQVTIPALNTIEGDPYRCTINRENGDDGDRRIKDSYWRCIGVPSFNMYNSALEDREGNTIEWKDNYEWKEDDAAFPFIYLWNKADNTITPQATSEFSFQPMHAYLVQNGGEIVWTAVSAKPSSIVARQRNTEPEEYNWRLELQQNNQMIDRTYIRMKDLESVTDGFDFGQDMSKEFNKKRSAIYSFIGTEKVAANSMTVHTDQTTIVPLGLDIKSAGEYVISLPEGTNGVGVVLVDSITSTRTNLGLMDYEVSLTAGKIDNRFFLEISPIVQTPTDVEEVTGNGLQVTGARKVIIDQKMFIIKDGKIYDAQGRQVK